MTDKIAMTNGAVLTAHEATVQTAQVEIRVMKVGKKQVTMGLFRQLPLRPITTCPGTLFEGEPWGHVNYWWDGDGRHLSEYTDKPITATALHVVWQLGDVLYRDVVYAEPRHEYLWHYEQIEEQAVTAVFLLLVGQASAWERIPGGRRARCRLTCGPQQYTFPVPERTDITEAASKLWQARCRTPEMQPMYAYQDTQARETYHALLQEWQLTTRSLPEAWAAFEAARSDKQYYIDEWAEQWASLCRLPQLFIAV
jgi:hypothetical protein